MTQRTSLEHAAARVEIQDVLHRYANLATEGADFDRIASTLFAADGEFVIPDVATVPAAEIGRIVGPNPPKFLRHHITTVVIDFNEDGTADVDAFFIAYTEAAAPDHWGRWRDVLRQEQDGAWRIVRKEPIVEGYDPKGLWGVRVDEEI